MIQQAAKFYKLQEIQPNIFRHADLNFWLAAGSANEANEILNLIGFETTEKSPKLNTILYHLETLKQTYCQEYAQIAEQSQTKNLANLILTELIKKGFDPNLRHIQALSTNTAVKKSSASDTLKQIYQELLHHLDNYELELQHLTQTADWTPDLVFSSWMPFDEDFSLKLLELLPKIFIQVEAGQATGVLANAFFLGNTTDLPYPYYINKNVFRPSYQAGAVYKQIAVWPGTGHKKTPLEYRFYASPEFNQNISQAKTKDQYSWEKFI